MHQQHRLFTSSATGWGVKLKGWRYPTVFNTDTGEVKFDNYGGKWGDEKRLNEFKQRCSVESAIMRAELEGRKYTETKLDDGRIRIRIEAEEAPARVSVGIDGSGGGDFVTSGAGRSSFSL